MNRKPVENVNHVPVCSFLLNKQWYLHLPTKILSCISALYEWWRKCRQAFKLYENILWSNVLFDNTRCVHCWMRSWSFFSTTMSPRAPTIRNKHCVIAQIYKRNRIKKTSDRRIKSSVVKRWIRSHPVPLRCIFFLNYDVYGKMLLLWWDQSITLWLNDYIYGGSVIIYY